MFSENLVMVEHVSALHAWLYHFKTEKGGVNQQIKIISANTLFFFQKKEKKRIGDVTICRLSFSDMKESISWHAM